MGLQIQCGEMNMMPLAHPSLVYGWSVSRVWYMPWRYNLYVEYLGLEGDDGHIYRDAHTTVIRHLTKTGLLGTLKLMDLVKRK